ncbi:MAG: AMP-binding protein [Candidatus Solibacter usitatus]|nr:AMP-binding protein [Candidatus Solibacter usitatus]
MPFRSPYPDAEIPHVPLSEFIFAGVEEAADEVALIDGPTGRSYTYGETNRNSQAVAAGLAQLGIGKGDKVAIISPNLPEYSIAVHGIMRAGACVTTMNPLYLESEIHHQLEDADARVFITVSAMLEKAKSAAKGTHVEKIFTFDDADGSESFTSLMHHAGPPPQVNIDPANDVAAMLYSSGTTGLPKGVMLTHRNLVAAMQQTSKLFGTGRARSLLILPVFHIYGFHCVANFDLLQRGTVVMMPRFDMDQFLGYVQNYKIERACLVPPIILGLVKSPLVDKYDLSSLKLVFSGAAPLDADLAAACEKRLNCKVRQGYGLTETSPGVCGHPIDGDKVRHGSVGVLVPNTEAKLIDLSTGEEATSGAPGELWVRGPQVMKGYYKNPDSTRNTITEDGWLRTGDIAVIDEDNWITIVDRAKELIKFKGLQVAPAELEAVLLNHPSIADAAVIGVPDEEAGELPKAFVVKKHEVTAEEVLAYVASQVAPYKKIRIVEFVDQIPKSPSGKILRRILKDREREKPA